MRSKKFFRSLLGTVAAFSGLAANAQAQTTPTNAQLIDKILAKVKPGDKFVLVDDTMLSVAELKAFRAAGAGSRQTESVFVRSATLWPGGNVPYVFDASISPRERAFFTAAAKELESIARLKFSVRTTETNYIKVITEGDANNSFIGRVGGEQILRLSVNSSIYVAAHEIMHALGIHHEQVRSDRDKFVTIDFSNIDQGKEGNFAILPPDLSNNRGVYDFESVMHYGENFFAIDGSRPNITVKAPNQRFQKTIGQQTRISALDKKGLVDIYGPPASTLPPANDNFAKAEVIEGIKGDTTGTNKLATEEPGEDAATRTNASASIWYRWKAANTGFVTFSTTGSAVDTTLGVYTGASVSSVTPVAFNDDETLGAPTPAAGLTSKVTFPAQIGATYYIAVDSFTDFQNNGPTGTIKLNWNQKVDASNLGVSGKITLSGNATKGVSGVTLTLSGAESSNSAASVTATSGASGEFSMTQLPGGNYNLSASKVGFSFAPASIRVSLTSNSTGNNFVATAVSPSSLPELYVSDVSMREGKSGDSFITFNVGLSFASQNSVTVNYATVNGTATAGTDYNALRGTLTFAPGTTTMAVNVRIRPDSVVESNETFTMSISNATNARIVDESGLATIINDDNAAAATDTSARTSKIQKPTRLARLDSARN